MESDRELIELANRGDAEAFEALYYRYRDWVYRLAWRFTGNREDASDVLQETFAYLLGKFPGFVGAGPRACPGQPHGVAPTSRMTTFLYPAVRHLSTSLRARSRRFASDREILDELAAPASAEPDSRRSELAAVLSVLPDEQREVLLMRFVDAMSLQEVAAALNIPVGTVKSRLHRALQRLRDDRRTRDYFLE